MNSDVEIEIRESKLVTKVSEFHGDWRFPRSKIKDPLVMRDQVMFQIYIVSTLRRTHHHEASYLAFEDPSLSTLYTYLYLFE